jgi:uncharacterized protein YeaO (DUF488 family)
MNPPPLDPGSPRRRRPVRIKRVYEAPEPGDGTRVLVDRLWPRGLSKARAAADLWLKDAGPTDALRRWFAHDPRRWKSFCRKYRAELDDNDAVLDQLVRLRRRGPLTLLYGARDTAHNNAVALRAFLEEADTGKPTPRRHRRTTGSREMPASDPLSTPATGARPRDRGRPSPQR